MIEMPPRKYLLFSGIQVVLDVTLLISAFAAAYLLRFDFHLTTETVNDFLIQVPLVVLTQFVALTVAGARASIWRYTDLAHLKIVSLCRAWFVSDCRRCCVLGFPLTKGLARAALR